MAGFSYKLQLVAALVAVLLTVLPNEIAAQSETGTSALVSPPAPESEQGARAKVEQFHAALLNSARMDTGFAAKAAVVVASLDTVFDIERIARISAGRIWRDLDDDAKAGYVALLRDLVTATYVSRFDADRGQRFETVSASVASPQRFVVRTRINRPDGKAVSLDYYFRGGRVFNVVADGVSDLSVRRADYAAIVKVSGFEGLMRQLRTQLTAARSSSPDQQ